MKESKDDKQTRLAGDLALADDVCREILNGHPQALNTLYDEYHVLFQKVTAKRTKDPELALEILQDFWFSLLDGEDICKYRAQKGISLKSYLTRRLNFRAIDAYRRSTRRNRRFVANDPDKPDMFIQRSDTLQARKSENEHLNGQEIDILNAALDILSDIRPNDASLVRYIMMEKTYDEIAELCGASSESDIMRKSAALRQQFLRAKARLRIIIERLTEEACK